MTRRDPADDTSPAGGLAAQASAEPADVVAMYDTWGPTGYDADLAAWGYDAPSRAAELVARVVGEGPVLDAGCGTGLVGVELRRRGISPLVGGDFSEASLETARSRGIYDEIVRLDLNAPLDLGDARFRAVVSVGVFSYLTDAAAALRELLRVVDPSGAVVFTQRTDLWDARGLDAVLEQLSDEDLCVVDVSPPHPYLPRHPEFGDEIGIHYATLIRC